MRHRNSGRKLGRNASHRKALFKNMATALLTYGRITTTEVKAKEIRGVIEPLIALSQKDDLHSRRQAYQVLCDHRLVKRLFDEIGPEFKGIAGGYTRVVKLALPRKGDCAPMAIIELIRGKHLQAVNSVAGAAAKTAPAGEKPAKKPAVKKATAKADGDKPAKKPAAKKAAKAEGDGAAAE